jgi:hypothetical protein
MIKIDLLEEQPDLSGLLVSKKKILDLAAEVNGSMLKFQTTVKTSAEIKALAEEFFESRRTIQGIQSRSGMLSQHGLVDKIHKTKNIKIDTTDFI